MPYTICEIADEGPSRGSNEDATLPQGPVFRRPSCNVGRAIPIQSNVTVERL